MADTNFVADLVPLKIFFCFLQKKCFCFCKLLYICLELQWTAENDFIMTNWINSLTLSVQSCMQLGGLTSHINDKQLSLGVYSLGLKMLNKS